MPVCCIHYSRSTIGQTARISPKDSHFLHTRHDLNYTPPHATPPPTIHKHFSLASLRASGCASYVAGHKSSSARRRLLPNPMRCADIYAFSTAACTYVTISTRIRSLSTLLSVRQMLSVRLIWPQLTICTDTLALRVPLVSSRSANCREYLTFTSSSTHETYAVTFAHMRHSC